MQLPRVLFICICIKQIESSLKRGSFDIRTYNVSFDNHQGQKMHLSGVLHNQILPTKFDLSLVLRQPIEENIYLQGSLNVIVLKDHLQPFLSGKRLQLCRFLGKPKLDMMLKIFFIILKDHGSQMGKCPLNQTQFNATGIVIKSSYMPTFTPPGRYLAQVELTEQTVGAAGQLQFEKLVTYKWFGEVVRRI